ncbi:DNA polymerase III subunit theta, partial [Shigella flexneri]|nr:DNA polymerase III subunit theta [Shigella flexneri]
MSESRIINSGLPSRLTLSNFCPRMMRRLR